MADAGDKKLDMEEFLEFKKYQKLKRSLDRSAAAGPEPRARSRSRSRKIDRSHLVKVATRNQKRDHQVNRS